MSAAQAAFDEPYQPAGKTRKQRKRAGLGRTSWYVQDLLPKGRLLNIAGPYSVGKTTATIDIVNHVMLGMDWRGHKHQAKKLKADDTAAKVLFVTAEGDIDPQITAWEEQHGIEIPDPQLIIYDEFSWDEDGESQERLEADIEYHEPHILIFDTHNAVGFTEQDPALWSVQIAWLRKLMRDMQDLTIIVIHHFGKDYGRGMRGLSAVAASADLIYEITPVDSKGDPVQKVQEASGFEFDREKNRVGRGRLVEPIYYSIEAVHLGVDEWGDPETGAVIGDFVSVDGPVRSKADDAYDVIKAVLAEGKTASSKNKLLAMVTEYAREHKVKGVSNRSDFMSKILPALVAAYRIVLADDGSISLGMDV